MNSCLVYVGLAQARPKKHERSLRAHGLLERIKARLLLVLGTKERKGLVRPLYPCCADVRNVDMTNQIAVLSKVYILLCTSEVILFISF